MLKSPHTSQYTAENIYGANFWESLSQKSLARAWKKKREQEGESGCKKEEKAEPYLVGKSNSQASERERERERGRERRTS